MLEKSQLFKEGTVVNIEQNENNRRTVVLDEISKISVAVTVRLEQLLKTKALSAIFNCPHFDMFVSFGGDGTILRATTYVKDTGIPIVGVNTGRLGFLSTFKKEDVRKVVQEFVKGDYGEQFEIMVEAGENVRRKWSVNKTSQRAVSERLSLDTGRWVGKSADLFLADQQVDGKMKKVVYARGRE